MLIAFCGIDGSGKTTQIINLKNILEKNGYTVFCTKEPSDWYRKDERVRRVLNQDMTGEKFLVEELALFAATDRLRHIQTEIIPHLEKGEIVITDRYVFSTYAYFTARGITDFIWLQSLNKYVPLPDLTFYIDVDPEDAIKRIISRDGKSMKKEETDMEAMRKVREVFVSQPWGEIPNYHVINGSQEIEKIATSITQTTLDYLNYC